MDEITFFGEVDKNRHGNISSQYPAWYFDVQVDELSESIDKKERELKRGIVDADAAMRMRNELEWEKAKLSKIKESKPRLTDKQKDDLFQEYKHISKQIGDSLFTRSEIMMGLASGHEVADRMTRPSIAVNPDIAKACNLKIFDGKISRNDASRAFKIIGKLLGEPTNVEYLRKDKATIRTGYRAK